RRGGDQAIRRVVAVSGHLVRALAPRRAERLPRAGDVVVADADAARPRSERRQVGGAGWPNRIRIRAVQVLNVGVGGSGDGHLLDGPPGRGRGLGPAGTRLTSRTETRPA